MRIFSNTLNLSFLILSLFFYNSLFSQPQIQWAQRFNSPSSINNVITDMFVDKPGNVYVTGYSSFSTTDHQIVTIKYNSQGIQQWIRFYNGSTGSEKPTAIAVDNSGNVIVTGKSFTGSQYGEILTINYNSAGDTNWVRKFFGAGFSSENPVAMKLDDVGNIYIGANGFSCSTCTSDILTLKYNSKGDLEWNRYYDYNNVYNDCYDIIIDNVKNVYVCGKNQLGGPTVILKFDTNGNILDTLQISGIVSYRFFLDKTEGFYLAGESFNTITRNDLSVMKINTFGQTIWQRNYHNSSTNNNDYFKAACLDSNNNIIITGVSGNSGMQGWDIATVKYTENGDTSWIRRYNPDPSPNSNDEPNDIISDKYGNTYVTGSSDSGFFARMLTIKYTSDGRQDWIARYDDLPTFATSVGVKVKCDTSGNLIVAGICNENGTNEFVTIKYSIATTIINLAENTSDKFELYQNYPNPFNPGTVIKFMLGKQSHVRVVIYNTIGEVVSTLTNTTLPQGTYQTLFDGSRFPAGIYFCHFMIEDKYVGTKKLILIK